MLKAPSEVTLHSLTRFPLGLAFGQPPLLPVDRAGHEAALLYAQPIFSKRLFYKTEASYFLLWGATKEVYFCEGSEALLRT